MNYDGFGSIRARKKSVPTRLFYGISGLILLGIDALILYTLYISATWIASVFAAPGAVVILLLLVGIIIFAGVLIILLLLGAKSIVVGITG